LIQQLPNFDDDVNEYGFTTTKWEQSANRHGTVLWNVQVQELRHFMPP